MSFIQLRPAYGPCPYDGRYKVVHGYEREYCTKLYCAGHAEDFMKSVSGDSQRVEPRNVFGGTLPCLGDWHLPAEIP